MIIRTSVRPNVHSTSTFSVTLVIVLDMQAINMFKIMITEIKVNPEKNFHILHLEYINLDIFLNKIFTIYLQIYIYIFIDWIM